MNPDIAVRLVILHEKKILLVNNLRDNFYYLPGGKMQKFETMIESINRELLEELGPFVHFEFHKILYLQDMILKEKEKHKFEVFVLGSINVFEEIEGATDPQHDGQDFFTWIDITELPETFKPTHLKEILIRDFEKSFNGNNIQYLNSI